MEPHELVSGTIYPVAKAERLPAIAARYTEVEMQLALMDRDLRWLEGAPRGIAERVRSDWSKTLGVLLDGSLDHREQALLSAAADRLRKL